MEEIPPKRRNYQIALITALATLGACLFLWQLAGKQPISGLRAASAVPGVQVKLSITDIHREQIAADKTRFKIDNAAAAPAASQTPAATPPPLPPGKHPSPTPELKQISLSLIKRPPSLSIGFGSGRAMLDWFDNSVAAKSFLESDVIQGIFRDVMATLQVRTDDLELSGMRGLTIMTMFREAVAAHGAVHYDMYEGRQGFTFNFVRSEAPILSRFLPLLTSAVRRHSYNVPGLNNPVVELSLGKQLLLLTEDKKRVYVSNGIKALLNVLDTPGINEVSPNSEDLVMATVRAETILDKLLPIIAGSQHWNSSIVLNFAGKPAAPELSLAFDPAKAFAFLRPQISPAVLSAIPQNVFASAAASFAIPPEMTADDWSNVALDKISAPQAATAEGGVALIWDLSAKKDPGLSNVGVVIYMPDPDSAAMKLSDYFNEEQTFFEECENGKIWLASSDELLLTRMKEACARQSSSLLNWFEDGSLKKIEAAPQLVFSFTPAVGFDETFTAGRAAPGGGEETEAAGEEGSEENSTKPASWKQAYQDAVERSSAASKKFSSTLPAFVFLGKTSASGAQLKGIVKWKDRPA